MPEEITAARLPELLRPGMTVFVAGASGAPTPLLEALAAAPEASRGVHYIGCRIPGLNTIDPAGFHPAARLTSFFVFGEIAKSHAAGRVRFLPLHYGSGGQRLANLAPDFDPRPYGHAKLGDLMRKTGAFEVDRPEGRSVRIRLKPAPKRRAAGKDVERGRLSRPAEVAVARAATGVLRGRREAAEARGRKSAARSVPRVGADSKRLRPLLTRSCPDGGRDPKWS